MSVNGRSVEVLVSGHTEEIVALLRDMRSISVEVAPVGLREIFLDKANAR